MNFALVRVCGRRDCKNKRTKESFDFEFNFNAIGKMSLRGALERNVVDKTLKLNEHFLVFLSLFFLNVFA